MANLTPSTPLALHSNRLTINISDDEISARGWCNISLFCIVLGVPYLTLTYVLGQEWKTSIFGWGTGSLTQCQAQAQVGWVFAGFAVQTLVYLTLVYAFSVRLCSLAVRKLDGVYCGAWMVC